eukprot:m.1381393 g.1381393  ORF g.1381393 m.1381393 type:complete len:65 (+) comp24970_c0_seq26:6733-6927(+)
MPRSSFSTEEFRQEGCIDATHGCTCRTALAQHTWACTTSTACSAALCAHDGTAAALLTTLRLLY